jgi:D-alanyl-D-alanine carboxypeptidase
MKQFRRWWRSLKPIFPLILIAAIILFNFAVIARLLISSWSDPSVSSSNASNSSPEMVTPPRPPEEKAPNSPTQEVTPELENEPSSSSELSVEKTPPDQVSSEKLPKFGHFPYSEGNLAEMITIASYAQREYQRFEQLHKDAALALMQLIYAARDDGIWIVPVSGYRSIEKQDQLFEAQIQRKGSQKAAAKTSAPPGHSEHHTGYAIDLTDGHFANQGIGDITYDFQNSEAFQWLQANADRFGFELSFPENNFQGISYEPWHWRFVGTPEAEATFSHAQNSITSNGNS